MYAAADVHQSSRLYDDSYSPRLTWTCAMRAGFVRGSSPSAISDHRPNHGGVCFCLEFGRASFRLRYLLSLCLAARRMFWVCSYSRLVCPVAIVHLVSTLESRLVVMRRQGNHRRKIDQNRH